MRSSNKSRSRNKNSNRNRSMGNVVNRVFDSAGPEGKVRGTPQQIIEKYQALARDAQLSGDRIAAENFQQHAEHYTRLLDDAQREQAERQAEQQRQQEQRRAEQEEAASPNGRDSKPDTFGSEDVQHTAASGDGPELVETPESAVTDEKPAPRPRTRRPRSSSRASGDRSSGEQNPAEATDPGEPAAEAPVAD